MNQLKRVYINGTGGVYRQFFHLVKPHLTCTARILFSHFWLQSCVKRAIGDKHVQFNVKLYYFIMTRARREMK